MITSLVLSLHQFVLSTMGCFLSNSSGVKEKQAGAKPAACSIPQCGTL